MYVHVYRNQKARVANADDKQMGKFLIHFTDDGTQWNCTMVYYHWSGSKASVQDNI